MFNDPLLDALWVDLDGPDFCGQLLAGRPHGVWLYFDGAAVRAVLWEHGELVEVIKGVS